MHAQSLLEGFDFTGESSQATSAPDVASPALDVFTSLSRGANAASSAGSNSFRTVGFQNNGIATTNTDYFQFAVSAAAGNTLSLTSIDTRTNGTAGFYSVSTQFAYSLDGTNFTLIGNPTNVAAASTSTSAPISYDLSSVSALQNLADDVTVTFRYYASGQTATGGFGFYSPASGLYGLDINGAVPEPATCFSGLLLVGALGWNQRRRLVEVIRRRATCVP